MMIHRRKRTLGAATVILFACSVVYYASGGSAAPLDSVSEVLRYLPEFEYVTQVDPEIETIILNELRSEVIPRLRHFMEIYVNGNTDVEIGQSTASPRCAVELIDGSETNGRSKRYALQGSKWNCKHLTYKISKYPKGLDRTDVDEAIARAFGVWSNYTDLSFSPTNGQVDIEIRFESGEHGAGNPFDGPEIPSESNVLAHAFYPNYGGSIHFDYDEDWTIGSDDHGSDLFYVAMHEIGHSLGLGHSDVHSALMGGSYKEHDSNFTLEKDDIMGLQALYGPKTRDQDPDLCQDPQIDTIFDTAEGNVYVFKENYYWRLTTDGIDAGYPKLISTGWKGLPSNIDAAFTDEDAKTYFFKGSKYWVYVNGRMVGHYPRKIRNDFPGIPDNIDAVTVNEDGQVYFYKGSKFWRFDPAQRPPIRIAHSEPIANWPGLPENVDAAISYNGRTYFFKGGYFYQFYNRRLLMDPMSPYETGHIWFGCDTESNLAPWSDLWYF